MQRRGQGLPARSPVQKTPPPVAPVTTVPQPAVSGPSAWPPRMWVARSRAPFSLSSSRCVVEIFADWCGPSEAVLSTVLN